ncbi:MAG: efflux RND transporter periplasmic adaptor subunit, partial [Candidatus Dadabacteria bacterium]
MKTQFLMAIFLTSLLSACSRDNPAAHFRTDKVRKADLTRTVFASGLTAPWRTLTLKSKASGEVLKVTVQEGDRVEAGKLLVELDRSDAEQALAEAKARLNLAETTVRITRARFERIARLRKQKHISADEYENAELKYAEAQAELATARSKLTLAQERLDDTTITAPISGVISRKFIEPGQIVASGVAAFSGGTDLLEMVTLDPIIVTAEFDEKSVTALKLGQQATVTLDAFPEREFKGTVLTISPVG